MFKECKELEYLDLSNFITSNVTDMEIMFYGCHKLKEIKGINNFNTSKVTNMNLMFSECYELEFIDLSNFNTINFTDMTDMFKGCYSLKEIKGINNFNLLNVTKKSGMFSECYELKGLDLPYSDNSFNDNLNYTNTASFRCTYDIKSNNEVNIINNILIEGIINEEIKSKIKILDGNQKKELVLKKKFDKLGYNTINFIIEENLNNMSFMFLGCSSLKKLNFYLLIHHRLLIWPECLQIAKN